MTKPMVRIHNTETDEIIDREMTDAEFTKYKKRQEIAAKEEAEAEAKEAAKAAILDKLGLTADESRLLLG